MKYFILFLFTIISISISAQSITDYKIGDEYKSSKDMIRTSVAGLEGTIFIYTNKKNIISSIGFVPSLNGHNIEKVSRQQFRNFIANLQGMYGVQFERTFENDRKKQHYIAKLTDSVIAITIDDYEESNNNARTKMTMMINKRKKK
ncbi:hypothetical protein [Flammeovirga kamogawensis]|uniref:DUF4252 domain-containing protein n=1 Tax=Flammeovirga kamogawensis TaxID=373891 RepID=A0ABX8GQ35_9BACT|nr:hypothetical protein [Flammeovirga kamogawensis]MBB6463476.1 hypothetical protein [Flammeovirga kamogawensis]QWG05598.1 hypothetical protein KM029_09400 [Flammeovirga kamogawensis]TRX67430.1 hypothetical protein EO216_04440 [Flammeovirga kamogawensis]